MAKNLEVAQLSENGSQSNSQFHREKTKAVILNPFGLHLMYLFLNSFWKFGIYWWIIKYFTRPGPIPNAVKMAFLVWRDPTCIWKKYYNFLYWPCMITKRHPIFANITF